MLEVELADDGEFDGDDEIIEPLTGSIEAVAGVEIFLAAEIFELN